MEQSHISLIVLAVYLTIQIYIGWRVGKDIKTEEGFILGNRQLGFWLTTATIFTTWLGAESMIGAAGASYRFGLSGARIEPFGYASALLLCGLFLSHKLREKRYTTLADLFSEVYSHKVEKFSVIILIPATLVWISAQNLAFATILSNMLKIEVWTGLVLSTVLIVSYSMLGGFLASAYTDFIQGICLVIGLIVLAFMAFQHTGAMSFSEFVEVAQSNKLPIQGGFFSKLDSWAIPILGSLVSQEVISRILAARTPKIAKSATFTAAGLYLLVGLIPVTLGLLAPVMGISPVNSDSYLAELAEMLLPGPIFIFFQLAIISAILSTADSSLLTVTSLTTHNFLRNFRKKLSNDELVLLNRFFVVVLGSITLALSFIGDSIFDLLEWASSLGTSGVLIITFFGLWTKMHNATAATATLAVGFCSTFILDEIPGFELPFIASIFLSFLTYVVIYRLKPSH